MVNGIIIISPEGEEFAEEVSGGGKHKAPLKRYLETNGLIYDGYRTETAYEMSIYLAYIHYLVINIENNRCLYYIGDAITTEQEKWYKKNRKRFRKYKTSIANMERDELKLDIKYYDEEILNMDGIKGYNFLKEIIADKRIIEIEEKEKLNK